MKDMITEHSRQNLPDKIKKEWQLRATALNRDNQKLRRAALSKKPSEAGPSEPGASCGNEAAAVEHEGSMLEVVWHNEPCTFWVESELGAGTFAKVFRVKQSMTHAQYALKVARSMGMDAAVAEYQVYTQLMGHPHILQCFGPVTVCMSDFPRFGLCLELCSDDLACYLTRPENLLANGASVPERWCFLFQILTGLRFIHERSILHADLKPNNVLVCQDRLLKISDFGKHGCLGGERRRQRPGIVFYTYCWPGSHD